MFYSKKIRTARDLRHLFSRKAPEPCAKGFWNRKFSVDLEEVVYIYIYIYLSISIYLSTHTYTELDLFIHMIRADPSVNMLTIT